MWILILAVNILCTLINANIVCNSTKCESSCDTLQWSKFESCENINLNNNSIGTIEPTSNYKSLKKLDLSYNKLRRLPENFLSNAIALTEIYLGYNNLEELPKNFLINSSKLQVLQLEGNLLSKIPSSVFHPGVNLSVDCTCNVANSIIQHLNKNSTDHSMPSVTCTTSSFASRFEKVDHFFAKNCGSQNFLALYIVLPIVALGLIVGGVALFIWKKNNISANFGSKTATDKSPSHGQPRYMTRNMDVTEPTLNEGPRQNYENVFVGPFQTKPHDYLKEQSRPGAPSEQVMEEDIYLESDVNEGVQPIYSNTQGVYYNYCDQGNISTKKEEDDVYILPDH